MIKFSVDLEVNIKIIFFRILKAIVSLVVLGLCYSLVRRRKHFKYGVTEIL